MNLTELVTDYISDNASEFFPGWTREALEDYVNHHMDQGTISVGIDENAEICGVLIGWAQMGDSHIPFRWQRHNPDGDHWWWDQFIADSPHVAASLIIDICEKFPMAVCLPSVAMRRGKIRKYSSNGALMKIYERAERLYGNTH